MATPDTVDQVEAEMASVVEEVLSVSVASGEAPRHPVARAMGRALSARVMRMVMGGLSSRRDDAPSERRVAALKEGIAAPVPRERLSENSLIRSV